MGRVTASTHALGVSGGEVLASDEIYHILARRVARALKLLKDAPIIDGHNDYPWAVREKAKGDIDALDLGAVEPMTQPYPLVNVFRPDVVQPSLDRDEVLAAAPSAEDGRFRVPPIIGLDL